MSGATWRQTGFLAAAGQELELAEIAVTVLGRFRSLGGFDLRSVASVAALHVVHAGHGTLECDGQTFAVNPGDAFCFLPGHRVHYFDAPKHPWRYTWVRLTGQRVRELVGELGFHDGAWCRSDLRTHETRALFEEIEAVYRSDDHSAFYPQAAAWRLLDRLSPHAEPLERGLQLATVCRRILDEQFRQPLQLGELARNLGVDRSTLFRRFRALYGASPKEYLDRMRLAHARALLQDGLLPVSEVAARCGYSSPARFSQAFRAHYGIAPSRVLRVE